MRSFRSILGIYDFASFQGIKTFGVPGHACGEVLLHIIYEILEDFIVRLNPFDLFWISAKL